MFFLLTHKLLRYKISCDSFLDSYKIRKKHSCPKVVSTSSVAIIIIKKYNYPLPKEFKPSNSLAANRIIGARKRYCVVYTDRLAKRVLPDASLEKVGVQTKSAEDPEETYRDLNGSYKPLRGYENAERPPHPRPKRFRNAFYASYGKRVVLR